MKWIEYSRYTGEDLGLSSEDLMRALADFFLQSGFEAQYMGFEELDKRSLDRLKDALERALREGDLFDENMRQAMRDKLDGLTPEQMDGLLENLVRKLAEDGYINVQDQAGEIGGKDDQPRDVKFDITDKSVDFLGFKTLKDLLAGLGRASFGAHDTRELSTGVEASGSSRIYEFGDTLNLDISETLFSAFRREGLGLPLNLEYEDLHVHQSEYQSSCATVLMLDCSHSMILYGEDRITPAKKVAMALAELIARRYPKATLDIVVFGNDAWQVSLKDLPYLQVGPFHTNTVAGLELAMDLLRRKKLKNRRIVMITDGKPSCIKRDGEYYMNSFGLDDFIVARTLDAAARARKAGIPITTFMIAQDTYLQRFIEKFTEANQGRAFYTGLQGLADMVFRDHTNSRKTS